ncbi:MAG: beta-ketoacyl-ACP synthase II [Bilifractor sp.]|jgi:beta-ketoacyl-acyl-carrier-protein synthase II
MARRVVVTGLGTVNPTGKTVAESWDNIKNGRSGIGEITLFDTSGFQSRVDAEVKDFDPFEKIDKKSAKRMARFTQFAVYAAKEAVGDSGLFESDDIDRKRIGVLISSGIGGMEIIEREHDRGRAKGFERVNPFFIPMTIANMAGAQIAIQYGLKGMCSCIVTACAGGSNAIGEAFHRIRDGYEDAFVCGGAEACITDLVVGGFTSLKALTRSQDPARASIPFDAERSGFVIGEGSGILILEELEHAKKRGAHIYAEIAGYGVNCDAYHITAPAPDGEGAADCLRMAIEDGGADPGEIDYINAHGTGTPLNDSTETAAFKKAFGERAYEIPISSTKSMTGHLLGGAGAIEGVFTVKAVEEGFVPPTIGLRNPDPECDLDYVPNQGRKKEIRYALSDNLGFGGHNSCLMFRKYE